LNLTEHRSRPAGSEPITPSPPFPSHGWHYPSRTAHNARIALIADWGTGTDVAVSLLQSVKQQKPDVVIHLGDVYYSGTEAECDKFFLQIVDDVLDRATGTMGSTLEHSSERKVCVYNRSQSGFA
jgi:hypothetical protein